MINDNNTYEVISQLADDIFSKCNDDAVCIRNKLSGLDKDKREALLTSDLLNAWQVFYFYFEANPGEDILEYLLFSPASSLNKGISIGEYKNCTMNFMVAGFMPVIVVFDDIQELKRFSGPAAFNEAIKYIDDGC